jgi:hypothetical protein
VTALYDFEAQAHGDLSFSAGDVIEIVHRTSNENEWWTGKLNGREGQFPGKNSLLMPSGLHDLTRVFRKLRTTGLDLAWFLLLDPLPECPLLS